MPTAEIVARVRDNLARVRDRISAAAARAGREPATVRLVGVTKYVEPSLARVVVEAGLDQLGESRPQELWRKVAALNDLPQIRWHLIGHLQTNKLRRTLPFLACLQSADSLKLLELVSREAAALGRPAKVLLEVNISGDAAKHGFGPAELPSLLPAIAALPAILVHGLMTMAALEGGLDQARRDFAALRELRDGLVTNCPPPIMLGELSMGMSDDFEVAIEEGATIVRVGSALFDGIPLEGMKSALNQAQGSET